jgi:hypothetical protein
MRTSVDHFIFYVSPRPLQDFEHVLECGVRASFVWAPHVVNISARLAQWREERGPLPDLLVLSSGLWPLLHVGDPIQFGRDLAGVRHQLEQVKKIK